MVPIHLKLKNFLSYREEVCLDFAPIHIACLAGDNGAGKSALLDAITWALWGKTRASNDREVISIGATEMEVTFTFGLAQREYRVFRRRSFTRGGGSGQHSLELFVRDPGGEVDEWLPISGDNVRETQEKINATLNMEYDTFVNSAFILQGRADTFTVRPPSERKKILGDILNLQEYDELAKMARDEERAIRERMSGQQGRIGILDEQLAVRPLLVRDLETTSAHLTEVSAQLDLAQELHRSLALQLTAWEQMRQMLDAATARAQREQTALARVETELVETERRQAELLELVADAESIEHGAAEHARWREVAARFAVTLRDVQAHRAAERAAERAIEQELVALTRERDSHVQAGRAAADRLAKLEREQERLTLLRREHDAAAREVATLPATRAKLEELRDERSRLHADNDVLKQRMHEIKANLEALQRGDAECPVCRRPLDPRDRATVADSWTTDGRQLGDRFRANKERMLQIDQALVALTEDETRLAEIDRANAQRAGVIQGIEVSLQEREPLSVQIATADAGITRLDAVIAADDFAHEARRQLAAAEAALTALDYDPVRHEEATSREQELAPFEARKRELDQARTRLDSAEQALGSLRVQRDERRQTVEEAQAEVASFQAQLRADPDLRERANAAADEVERLDREKTQIYGKQSGIERRLLELDSLQAERDRLDAEIRDLGLDSGALKELIEAFGRNGIQAMIVENVLPELEDEANALLRQMSSSQLHVAFRSQRQALSTDSIIETLDIIIRDEYGERPYALYSGGEAFRINFAVRVALSKLLARRAGANIDMLVIDEGFGTQDSRGRDGLIEALRSIENDFRTILVITHIGEIRELFPTRIDVIKTERGSQVTVN